MTRTYQSRRRKPQPKTSANLQHDKFSSAYLSYATHSDPIPARSIVPCITPSTSTATKTDSIVLKYHRTKSATTSAKRLSNQASADDDSGDKKSRSKDILKVPLKHKSMKGTTRVTSKSDKMHKSDCNGKENRRIFRLKNHYKDQDRKQFEECQQDVISRDESVDSTTSFLSALSLQQHSINHVQSDKTKQSKASKLNQKKKGKPSISRTDTEQTEVTIQSNAITLDDICNDAVDIEERMYDPESLSNIADEWPSWVPKQLTPNNCHHTIPATEFKENSVTDSPSKKRKRDNSEEVYNSPPTKKQKSPHVHCKAKSRIQGQGSKSSHSSKHNASKLVFSTLRKNKRRSRRRSSIRSDFNCSNLNLSAMVTPALNGRKIMSRLDQMTNTNNTNTNLNVNVKLNLDQHHFQNGNSNSNPLETPTGSIRTQRIHRLARKSHTDLLMEVLLREDLTDCPQMNEIEREMKRNANQKRKSTKFTKSKKSNNTKRVTFNDLNGLQSLGRMDSVMETTCLFLLKLGADPLWLNQDGVSPIYIAMHYQNAYSVLSVMIKASVIAIADPSELNQTYVFANHGTLSLMDIALRIGETKTVRLCLENDMMPTPHSRDHEPRVELLSFCASHRMLKLGTRVLKEQWFDAVENLDMEYMESILCHGIDVDIKKEGTTKTALYWLVEQPFDVYDNDDAKDQYETIDCLLRNGADPNAMDREMSPMLIYPLQRSGRWNIKLVDLLLVYRANLKLKVGETSKTLYQYAKDNCVCDEILKIIATFYKDSGRISNNKSKETKKRGIKTVNVDQRMTRKGSKVGSNSNSRGGSNGREKVLKVNKVEVKDIDNPELEVVMQTKNVVKKAYSRNRKSVKRGV